MTNWHLKVSRKISHISRNLWQINKYIIILMVLNFLKDLKPLYDFKKFLWKYISVHPQHYTWKKEQYLWNSFVDKQIYLQVWELSAGVTTLLKMACLQDPLRVGVAIIEPCSSYEEQTDDEALSGESCAMLLPEMRNLGIG